LILLVIGGLVKVEGYITQAKRVFPFSKPSPFSSMTDGNG